LLFILDKIPAIQQELSYTIEADGKKASLNDDDMPLKYVKLPKDKVLNLKNLGKQIRWDYVFYVEYLGPILILPIFYLLGNK
jgi:very-long-chain enoyl-CoA reductase